MKDLIKLKHWQVFSIFTICYIIMFIFQENDFNIFNVSSLELAAVATIITLILFFLWVMTIGIFLNGIPENPYHFRKWILIIAVFGCIIGYSDLNLQRLGFEILIPGWLKSIEGLLTGFGIIYTFHRVPKSLKSIELGRKVKFSECIIDAILLFAFPIGVWFIQPRLNRIHLVAEMIENEEKQTTNR